MCQPVSSHGSWGRSISSSPETKSLREKTGFPVPVRQDHTDKLLCFQVNVLTDLKNDLLKEGRQSAREEIAAEHSAVK